MEAKYFKQGLRMMEESSLSPQPPWQKNLKLRGYRLLAWAVPILLMALVAASLIPRAPSATIEEGSFQGKHAKGVMMLSGRAAEVVPLMILLKGRGPLPSPGRLQYRLRSQDRSLDVKRQVTVIPQALEQGWQFGIMASMPAVGRVNYHIQLSRDWPVQNLEYSWITHPQPTWVPVLRVVEMLLYPALAFSLLGLVMVLFPRFVSR